MDVYARLVDAEVQASNESPMTDVEAQASEIVARLEDIAGAVARRCAWLREQVHGLNKRGAVVQLSGGIDSSVVLHLCAAALGPDQVVALYLPDSSTGPDTRRYVEAAARSAGVALLERSITETIEAQTPAAQIAELLRRYAPEYDPAVHAYSVNAVPGLARRLGTLVYQVAIGPRRGAPERTLKLSVDDLRALIAYQNRKQRTRMLFAYAEAEARNYAVVGASNGDELDTGFVVKYGDDAADLCAIGDLPKPRVYEFARHLGVPQAIIDRPPTTDTYALTQTQEDYYYALPADVLRRLLRIVDAADRRAADAAADGPDAAAEAELAAIAAQCPGWTSEALLRVGRGLSATLHYQRTRSLRPDRAALR